MKITQIGPKRHEILNCFLEIQLNSKVLDNFTITMHDTMLEKVVLAIIKSGFALNILFILPSQCP